MRKKKFTIPTLVFVMASLYFCDINSVDQAPDLIVSRFINALKKKHDDNRKLKVPSNLKIQSKIIQKIADIISPFFNSTKSHSESDIKQAITLLETIDSTRGLEGPFYRDLLHKLRDVSKQKDIEHVDGLVPILKEKEQNLKKEETNKEKETILSEKENKKDGSTEKSTKVTSTKVEDTNKEKETILSEKENKENGPTEEDREKVKKIMTDAIKPFFIATDRELNSDSSVEKVRNILISIRDNQTPDAPLIKSLTQASNKGSIQKMIDVLDDDFWKKDTEIKKVFELSTSVTQAEKYVDKYITKGDHHNTNNTNYVDCNKLQSFVKSLIADSQALPEETFDKFVGVVALAYWEASGAIAKRFPGLMSGWTSWRDGPAPRYVTKPFLDGIYDAFSEFSSPDKQSNGLNDKSNEALKALQAFKDNAGEKNHYPLARRAGQKDLYYEFIPAMLELRDLHDKLYIDRYKNDPKVNGTVKYKLKQRRKSKSINNNSEAKQISEKINIEKIFAKFESEKALVNSVKEFFEYLKNTNRKKFVFSNFWENLIKTPEKLHQPTLEDLAKEIANFSHNSTHVTSSIHKSRLIIEFLDALGLVFGIYRTKKAISELKEEIVSDLSYFYTTDSTDADYSKHIEKLANAIKVLREEYAKEKQSTETTQTPKGSTETTPSPNGSNELTQEKQEKEGDENNSTTTNLGEKQNVTTINTDKNVDENNISTKHQNTKLVSKKKTKEEKINIDEVFTKSKDGKEILKYVKENFNELTIDRANSLFKNLITASKPTLSDETIDALVKNIARYSYYRSTTQPPLSTLAKATIPVVCKQIFAEKSEEIDDLIQSIIDALEYFNFTDEEFDKKRDPENKENDEKLKVLTNKIKALRIYYITKEPAQKEMLKKLFKKHVTGKNTDGKEQLSLFWKELIESKESFLSTPLKSLAEMLADFSPTVKKGHLTSELTDVLRTVFKIELNQKSAKKKKLIKKEEQTKELIDKIHESEKNINDALSYFNGMAKDKNDSVYLENIEKLANAIKELRGVYAKKNGKPNTKKTVTTPSPKKSNESTQGEIKTVDDNNSSDTNKLSEEQTEPVIASTSSDPDVSDKGQTKNVVDNNKPKAETVDDNNSSDTNKLSEEKTEHVIASTSSDPDVSDKGQTETVDDNNKHKAETVVATNSTSKSSNKTVSPVTNEKKKKITLPLKESQDNMEINSTEKPTKNTEKPIYSKKEKKNNKKKKKN